jgi:hypothetical protein
MVTKPHSMKRNVSFSTGVSLAHTLRDLWLSPAQSAVRGHCNESPQTSRKVSEALIPQTSSSGTLLSLGLR